MVGSNSRQSLVTAVSIKRPLTPGFKVLLSIVAILAIAAAAVAWHSEKQHRRAKQAVKVLSAEHGELSKQMSVLRTEAGLNKEMLKLQQARLDSLLAQGPQVRQRWLTSRVADSVAVAEQALLINHDAAQAQQALLAADRLLAGQADVSLMPLRRALQQDLSVLSGLPRVDVAGIYLRLQNLDRRVTTLALPREAGRQVPQVVNAQDKMENLWQQGLAKFRALIVIRQYDEPLQPLLDASRLQLLRDQLSLLINQAELALLRGDGVVYRAALETLSLRVQQQLSALPSATLVPLLDELAALQALQVQLSLPSLSTRAALDVLMQTAETRL
ncbi:uroporphyrinogen-III C-methyltransferase [Perlucidibaca aquatica]|uniref:uroporphyrinogen-III C-methyltransferase n=1 Tax=Perlucidibaca aquatica TaxID=1852776 RepID=UPI0012FDCC5F|nr:uroporphyrinogen-III C-methyltransferase [Perlucidibaca aquatica]